MRIAIIGAGNVGGTLGRRWASLGHDVTFGVRDVSRGAAAVKGVGDWPPTARVATPAEAVRDAEVVVVATPWAATADALRDAGGPSAFAGRTVVDATNPLGPGLTLLTGPDGASGAEQVQALLPGAHVVKAFNTTGYENMAQPVYDGGASLMLVAGDDAAAKDRVRTLATALGFEAVDAGALVRARHLEHLAAIWIGLAFAGGQGRDIAFRLMRR